MLLHIGLFKRNVAYSNKLECKNNIKVSLFGGLCIIKTMRGQTNQKARFSLSLIKRIQRCSVIDIMHLNKCILIPIHAQHSLRMFS